MNPSNHELLGVSILDANGNEYAADVGSQYLDDKPGDVERYRVKSHVYGTVDLGLEEPCSSLRNYSCLNAFRTP
jgi:hypothetical protein